MEKKERKLPDLETLRKDWYANHHPMDFGKDRIAFSKGIMNAARINSCANHDPMFGRVPLPKG